MFLSLSTTGIVCCYFIQLLNSVFCKHLWKNYTCKEWKWKWKLTAYNPEYCIYSLGEGEFFRIRAGLLPHSLVVYNYVYFKLINNLSAAGWCCIEWGKKKQTWECQHLSDGGRLVISCRLTWATTDTASCWHLGVLNVLISSGISASAKCEQHLTSRLSFKPSTGRWEILIGELSFSTSSCLRVGAISSFSAALEALWRNLCVSYVQWELARPRRALNRAGLVPGAPSVPSVPSVPGVCAAKYQWK